MVRVLNLGGRELAERISAAFPDVDVVRVRRDEPLDGELSGDVLIAMTGARDLIAKLAPRVDWVHVMGTGIDWLPAETFEAHTVTCARGGSAIAISEFVLGAMLSFEKQYPELWARPPDAVFGGAALGGLCGRHLGLLGIGGIGTEIARRALPFGMTVSAARRHPGPAPLEGIEVIPFDEVIAQADHLVLTAPLTSRTRHLINRAALDAVKPGLHLVNIARGGLIDHDALREALDDGRVARATLDVCEPEPPPPGHWLYTHPKVRLTGHISWSSAVGIEPLYDAFIDNLGRYVEGRPLEGVVDRGEGY